MKIPNVGKAVARLYTIIKNRPANFIESTDIAKEYCNKCLDEGKDIFVIEKEGERERAINHLILFLIGEPSEFDKVIEYGTES